MKRILLLSLTLLLVSFGFVSAQFDFENPQSYTIGGFEVEGCVATSKNSVIIHTGLRIGDRISIPGPQVGDAIKALWEQGVFEDVNISVDRIVDQNIFLKISVVERPKIDGGFKFSKGVTKSQADELREKLRFVRGMM